MEALGRATFAFEQELILSDKNAEAQDVTDSQPAPLTFGTDNGSATIDALPAEVIARILLFAVGSAPPGLTACQLVSAASCTNHALRGGAALCWPELALALFLPLALPPPPRPPWMRFCAPRDWRRCVASTQPNPALLPGGWRPVLSSITASPSAAGGIGVAANPCGSGSGTSQTDELITGNGTFLPRDVFAHTACVYHGKVFVFGGRHAQSHSARLDVLDLSSDPLVWSQPSTHGTTPLPRRQHTAALDSSGRMHIIGGGCNEAGERLYRAGMHSLDLETFTWEVRPSLPGGWACMAHSCLSVPEGSIPPHDREDATHGAESHSSLWSRGDSLIVFGGLTTKWQEFTMPGNAEPIWVEQPVVNDSLLRFDVSADEWTALHPSGIAPSGRFRHSATLLPAHSAMVVWGGFLVTLQNGADGQPIPGWDETCANELFLLHLPSLSWSVPRLSGNSPAPRGGHSAVLVGEHLLLLGGCDGGEDDGGDGAESFIERDLSDFHTLDTRSWAYHPVTPAGRDLPVRSGHTTALVPWDGGVGVLILGGRDYRAPERPFQDGEHLGRSDAYLLLL